MSDQEQKQLTYPCAFTFGFTSGVVLNMFTRFGTMEPLCARPFSYLRTGITFMAIIGYYDWWRRQAMQEVMTAEDKTQYYKQMKAMNSSIRYGEENDIVNLTDYLAGHTTRV
jgi:hypothetical protein